MVFSTNQVRQLYVLSKAIVADQPNTVLSDVGAASVKTNAKNDHLYIKYNGAGGLTRSDLISTSNIHYVDITSPSKMGIKLKRVKVALDSTVNGGNPVVGQDYILRIVINQFVGLSDEDQYFKYGMAHVVSGMTSQDVYKALALSLAKNFSRELTKFFNFYVGSSTTPVTADMKLADVPSGDYIIIEEVE
jgi:hypothetical protein